jgi:hypothetical protein
MMYAFAGFSSQGAMRVFLFNPLPRTVNLHTRRILVDTGMARKYGIPLQELPRLCMALLDKDEHAADGGVTTYAEADMKHYQRARAEAVELAKMRRSFKPRRAPGAEPDKVAP